MDVMCSIPMAVKFDLRLDEKNSTTAAYKAGVKDRALDSLQTMWRVDNIVCNFDFNDTRYPSTAKL